MRLDCRNSNDDCNDDDDDEAHCLTPLVLWPGSILIPGRSPTTRFGTRFLGQSVGYLSSVIEKKLEEGLHMVQEYRVQSSLVLRTMVHTHTPHRLFASTPSAQR